MLFGVKSVKLTLALPRGARRQRFGDSWHRWSVRGGSGAAAESKATGFATILARIYGDDFKIASHSYALLPFSFFLFLFFFPYVIRIAAWVIGSSYKNKSMIIKI